MGGNDPGTVLEKTSSNTVSPAGEGERSANAVAGKKKQTGNHRNKKQTLDLSFTPILEL